MKVTLDIPDAIVPDLKEVAKKYGEVELEQYLFTLIIRGFRKNMVEEALSTLQADTQEKVNNKLLQIKVTTTTTRRG